MHEINHHGPLNNIIALAHHQNSTKERTVSLTNSRSPYGHSRGVKTVGHSSVN